MPSEVAKLESLPDFDSLLSSIEYCQRLYRYFQDNNETILRSVASNIHRRAIQYDSERQVEPFLWRGSSLIFHQLMSAIENASIPRVLILDIFKNAWLYLFSKGLEELLIPIGMRLALSFELDDCHQDAIALLTQIQNRQPPFDLSISKPQLKGFSRHKRYVEVPPTFAPLEALIAQLQNVDHSVALSRLKDLQELPIAFITGNGIIFFTSNIGLQGGIHNGDGFTLVRLSNPPRPGKIYNDSDLERMLGSDGVRSGLQFLRSGAARQ
ncbi:hypothetical protein ZTR_09473 [Talaromyces verruculosus]|nr:hypothetical protein ZTR_09473 [Talaromyces verruculosus]